MKYIFASDKRKGKGDKCFFFKFYNLRFEKFIFYEYYESYFVQEVRRKSFTNFIFHVYNNQLNATKFRANEFVEEYADVLKERAVVYLNVDMIFGNKTLYRIVESIFNPNFPLAYIH